jgi:hypothetical protein
MEDDTNYTGEEEMQNWGAMNQQEMEQNEMEEPNEIAEQNSNKEEENPNQTEENELMYIYEWVDSIPLSRPKKNISRDFCDCVLLAEIIKHYIPRLVDLHNYPSTSSTKQKTFNWDTLNDKVLKKIRVRLTKKEINDIISCQPLSIEHLLQRVYDAIQNYIGRPIGNSGIQNDMSRGGRKNNQNRVNELKMELERKEQSIEHLSEIIEVLEMKLQGSKETEQLLATKVQELTDLLQSRGIEV